MTKIYSNSFLTDCFEQRLEEIEKRLDECMKNGTSCHPQFLLNPEFEETPCFNRYFGNNIHTNPYSLWDSIPQNGDDVIMAKIDKGEIHLSLKKSEPNMAYAVTYPQNCLATVTHQISANVMNLRHSDNSCATGSIIDLNTNGSSNLVLQLQGGVLEIKNTKAFLKHYSQIDVVVRGGVVTSKNSKIKVNHHYAPAQAHYKNDSNPNGPVLEIEVLGGVVEFK